MRGGDGANCADLELRIGYCVYEADCKRFETCEPVDASDAAKAGIADDGVEMWD